MASRLENWWRRLEVAFPLSGPRRHLREVHGDGFVDALEWAGILRQQGVAAQYPCPRRSSPGCPRRLVKIDDTWRAICGNESAECGELALSSADVAAMKLDPLRLCRAVGEALTIRPAPEAVAGMTGVFRVGSVITQAGIRHPVYLVVRGGNRGLMEAIEALRCRQDSGRFAVLVPTDRFLSDDLGRSARAGGVVVLVLADTVGFEAGRFVPLIDPAELFADLDRSSTTVGQGPIVVARALVRDRGRAPQWLDLDQKHYDEVRLAAGRFDVLADERNRAVQKMNGEGHQDVPSSYFGTIRAAANCRGLYDPNIHGPDMGSAKQTFQRARAIFDLKVRNSTWRIFPSVKTDEGHTVYRFAPDPDVSFAFLFLPEP